MGDAGRGQSTAGRRRSSRTLSGLHPGAAAGGVGGLVGAHILCHSCSRCTLLAPCHLRSSRDCCVGARTQTKTVLRAAPWRWYDVPCKHYADDRGWGRAFAPVSRWANIRSPWAEEAATR